MTSINATSEFDNQYQPQFDGESHRTLDHETEKQLDKGKSLSSMLRIFGACAVIASLSLFLIEGWTDGNDLSRYLKLLAQTGLITSAGLFLSFIVKEVKGARMFFGLGLIAAVANFTILGALTYSIFPLDSAQGDYHSMLKWQAISLGEFLPLAIGAIVFLSFLTRFSFSIFARSAAGKLSLAFLLLNALLLVPAREAIYVSVLAGVALLVATQMTLGIIKRKELLLTAEAKFALACLFVPGLIIVCRALGLYAMDELVLLTVSALAYYALRTIGLQTQSEARKRGLAISQYLTGLVSAALLTSLVPESIEVIRISVLSLAILGVTYDIARLQSNANVSSTNIMVTLSTAILLGTNVINALALDTFAAIGLSTLLMLATLVVNNLLANNNNMRLLGSQLMALGGVLITGILMLIKLVVLMQVGAWVMIGGAGVLLIVLASLYERYGMSFKFAKAA